MVRRALDKADAMLTLSSAL